MLKLFVKGHSKQTKLALPEKDSTIAEIDDNLDQQV